MKNYFSKEKSLNEIIDYIKDIKGFDGIRRIILNNEFFNIVEIDLEFI